MQVVKPPVFRELESWKPDEDLFLYRKTPEEMTLPATPRIGEALMFHWRDKPGGEWLGYRTIHILWLEYEMVDWQHARYCPEGGKIPVLRWVVFTAGPLRPFEGS